MFQLSDKAPLLFSVTFILMLANWSVEAVKWRRLIKEVDQMSFLSALKGVLAGISTGIVTPNRLGNFIGRTAFLKPEIRLKATLLTLVANLAQFVVTIFLGCVGLFFMSRLLLGDFNYLLFIGGLVALLFGMAVYINPLLINRRPFNFFFSDKISEEIRYISTTSFQLKIAILGWSMLRYGIFCFQYVLLLLALNQEENITTLLAAISVVYLLMTLIPSLFFGKLFVREAAALLVLAAIGIPDQVILLSGFLLWFVNIALPSLLGMGLLISKK